MFASDWPDWNLWGAMLCGAVGWFGHMLWVRYCSRRMSGRIEPETRGYITRLFW